MQVVKVDHIRLQATQCRLAGGLERFRPAIDHALELAVAFDVRAMHAAFAGQRDFAAMRLQHLPEQRFVRAKAIQRRRVEQRDACIQRGEQHALGLLARRRRAVGMAEIHAAQTDRAHSERAECAHWKLYAAHHACLASCCSSSCSTR